MNLKRATVVALTPLFLAACYGGPPMGGEGYDDFDGDGYTSLDDCNDDDAAINPAAIEVCDDEIDNDCDDSIDGEGLDEICGDELDNNCDGVVDEEDCVEDDTSAGE